MSEILGFGVNSYRQYEAGDIPTVASGRLIQAARDPEEFKKFGPVPAEYDKLYVKLKDDDLATIGFVEFDNGNYGETVTAAGKFDDDGFTRSELDTLKDVVEKFGSCSTSKIVNISHREKAWRDNEPEHELISYQKYAFDLQAIQ